MLLSDELVHRFSVRFSEAQGQNTQLLKAGVISKELTLSHHRDTKVRWVLQSLFLMLLLGVAIYYGESPVLVLHLSLARDSFRASPTGFFVDTERNSETRSE